MRKRSVMMIPSLAMTLAACGGGNTGIIAAPPSGSGIQAEAKTEEKTEVGTAGQEEEGEGRAEASGGTVTSKLSNNQPDGDYTTIVVEWFVDQVGECIDGRIDIEVYNNGTLGDAISCLEQSQYGGMNVVEVNFPVMTNFMDKYNALMMPYIYKNTEHSWRVHGGGIGTGALRGNKMKEKELYRLTYYDGGARCLYNTRKEIHSPEGMEGISVRVQQPELMMSMAEALGGQLVVAAYSEVYSAFQTGVVDAAENSIVNYLDQSCFEMAFYLVKDRHIRPADVLVMGEKSCGKLSAEGPKIIDDTVLESQEHQKELWVEAEEEPKQELLEQNVAIIGLTEDELKVSQDACEPIWCSYEDSAYKSIIDQIVEAGKQRTGTQETGDAERNREDTN